MKLPERHISIITEKEVNEIAKPFFDASGITYFHYAEFFKNGYCCGLCSNTGWHKFFFEFERYKLNANYPANGYHLAAIKNPITAANAKNYFGIAHFLSFTKEHDDHYMMAAFGTYAGNDRIIDYYLNNIDVLERFISYFKQQANGLIKSSKKPGNLIVLPEYVDKGFKLKPDNKNRDKESFAYLNIHKNLFSKRELDCIEHFTLGATIRETADKLLISPRTVETYLENIKDKLGCNKKSELISKLLKNGFVQSAPG